MKLNRIAILLILISLVACKKETMNHEPVATLDIGFAFHGVPYEGQLAVTDPDNDELIIGMASDAPWLAFDRNTLKLSGTPTFRDIGPVDLEIRVNDGKESFTIQLEFEVKVTPANCGQNYGDPEASLYILPIRVGGSTMVTQGSCRPQGSGGHVGYFVYDLFVPDSDTVFVARSGTVLTVREDQKTNDPNFSEGKENFMYVKHNDGTVARYVHFRENSIFPRVGDQLIQGDPMGIIARSRPTNTPHLHMDVFINDWWNRYNFDIGRHFSIPLNFSNAEGEHNFKNGLIQGETYIAKPY